METSRGSIQRPILLWIPILLSALGGAALICIGLWMIVADLPTRPAGPMGHLGALLGAFLLVPGTLELLVAYGLVRLKPWGWWLGVITHALLAILFLQTVFNEELSPRSLLIIIGMLAYEACLFIPQVRRAFRPAANQSQVSEKEASDRMDDMLGEQL